LEPLPALFGIPDHFDGADHEAVVPSSVSQQEPLKRHLTRLVPIIAVSIALIVAVWSFREIRKGKSSQESGSVAGVSNTSGQPKLEIPSRGHVTHSAARESHRLVAAKLETAQAPDSATEDDPAELWNAVKRGNVRAEVALANLYLKGQAVPQSCEQAHMLFLAASMKGSRLAEESLKSIYAQRCE
jgi:hypothetical protein